MKMTMPSDLMYPYSFFRLLFDESNRIVAYRENLFIDEIMKQYFEMKL